MSIQLLLNPASMSVADRERLAQILDLFPAARGAVTLAPAVPIAPDDNPAAGVELLSANQAFTANPNAAFAGADPTASQAFAGADPTASQAFAAPLATGTDPNLTAAGSVASTASANAAPESLPGAVANAPAATTANAGVEVDKNGLPWDPRIHAETKSKNKDQSWRNKRGVAPEVIASVEAQLRALMAAPGAAPLAPVAGSQVAGTPAVPNAPAPAPVAPNQAAPLGNVPPPPPASTAPNPVAPPSVAAAATPTNAGSVSPSNFVEFIAKVAPMMQAGGRLTQDEVKAACLAHGVPDLALVSARPDLIPAINASIDAVLATKPA